MSTEPKFILTLTARSSYSILNTTASHSIFFKLSKSVTKMADANEDNCDHCGQEMGFESYESQPPDDTRRMCLNGQCYETRIINLANSDIEQALELCETWKQANRYRSAQREPAEAARQMHRESARSGIPRQPPGHPYNSSPLGSPGYPSYSHRYTHPTDIAGRDREGITRRNGAYDARQMRERFGPDPDMYLTGYYPGHAGPYMFAENGQPYPVQRRRGGVRGWLGRKIGGR